MPGAEIIVADGNSADHTVDVASEHGVSVLRTGIAGRAHQMNAGAACASGDILYFLHADTIPPENFLLEIKHSLNLGYHAGCFRLQFDYPHWFLKLNAWFTRFNINSFRFGDQSLFVRKKLFESIGGFSEDLLLMEDQEIVARIRRYGKFVVVPEAVTTSARKYRSNGVFRLQCIYYLLYAMYKVGFSQRTIHQLYYRLIKTPLADNRE